MRSEENRGLGLPNPGQASAVLSRGSARLCRLHHEPLTLPCSGCRFRQRHQQTHAANGEGQEVTVIHTKKGQGLFTAFPDREGKRTQATGTTTPDRLPRVRGATPGSARATLPGCCSSPLRGIREPGRGCSPAREGAGCEGAAPSGGGGGEQRQSHPAACVCEGRTGGPPRPCRPARPPPPSPARYLSDGCLLFLAF